MSRNLAADCSLARNEYSSICQNGPSTAPSSLPIVPEPAQEEAQLVMRRLVREYLERRPIEAAKPAARAVHAIDFVRKSNKYLSGIIEAAECTATTIAPQLQAQLLLIGGTNLTPTQFEAAH